MGNMSLMKEAMGDVAATAKVPATVPVSSPSLSSSLAHLLRVEALMPSSSESSTTLLSLLRNTRAAALLNCLSYLFLVCARAPFTLNLVTDLSHLLQIS